jgi:hypothetical protein
VPDKPRSSPPQPAEKKKKKKNRNNIGWAKVNKARLSNADTMMETIADINTISKPGFYVSEGTI